MHMTHNVSIRTKYKVITLIWLIGGSVLLLATIYLTQYFLVGLLVLFATVGLYALSLRCPNCGKRVLSNPLKIFGKQYYIWTSKVPKKCTHCGTDLG